MALGEEGEVCLGSQEKKLLKWGWDGEVLRCGEGEEVSYERGRGSTVAVEWGVLV